MITKWWTGVELLCLLLAMFLLTAFFAADIIAQSEERLATAVELFLVVLLSCILSIIFLLAYLF